MQFLLEKLASAGAGLPREEAAADAKAAIAAQIQRIVSCRPWDSGEGGALLDFGMPSPVDVAYHGGESLDLYAARLARLIARHEPRLLNVSVSVEADAGPNAASPWRLVVSGVLGDGAEEPSFQFALGEP